MKRDGMISIVMPVYNAETYLEASVQSVLGQTYEDWELLLTDDHSTDKSAAMAKRLAAQDSRIRVLTQKDGIKGAANARNLGTSQAQGRYLCFLDADDVWRPDKLEKEFEFLKRTGAAFVF